MKLNSKILKTMTAKKFQKILFIINLLLLDLIEQIDFLIEYCEISRNRSISNKLLDELKFQAFLFPIFSSISREML